MAKMALGPARKRNLALLAGVVLVIGGVAALAHGLAPLKGLMDTVGPAFNGGKLPEDLQERMDASFRELGDRLWADVLGVALLVVGVLLLKRALGKPRAVSMEDLVRAEVERRMAAASAAAAPTPGGARIAPTDPSAAVAPPPPPGAPAARPARGVPHGSAMPLPATFPAPQRPGGGGPGRRTHCEECGSVLVAGGRLCPRGHRQA